jgi:hypothetical protein
MYCTVLIKSVVAVVSYVVNVKDEMMGSVVEGFLMLVILIVIAAFLAKDGRLVNCNPFIKESNTNETVLPLTAT